ncbi:CPBP family intramembrane glutamic endopeptidase [Arsenicibacter rosenii]|uniref:CAAX prenyl protease 2/Lysostaphin resistance protein A-like domain-containing protein n=1 Tax=Arsenicibacter rosenii TaxID=1750698 RepID=A0A1S2VGU6_9BACT|nr:type II CAAX endopeptidase family protein [Arsenicibacter rosenii]OIN57944.1 hypothetical protein BLX24_17790 [Arsenicibacter rosenii]
MMTSQLPENNEVQYRPAYYPTIKQAWWLMAVMMLMQIPAVIPSIGLKLAAEKLELPVLDMIGQTLAYVLAFGLTIWYAFGKRGSRTLSFATVPAIVYPVAAIGMIALGLLAEPLVSTIPMPEKLNELLRELFNKDMVITAVIAAPILEEVLFRGIIEDGFLKQYSPAKSIIWSAVIFGVIHMIPAQALNACLLGLAFGWLYYRTRSLWLCMFLHFVNNSLSSLPLFFDDALQMDVNTTRLWIGNDGLYMGLLAACAAICYGCYAYLNRILPEGNNSRLPV